MPTRPSPRTALLCHLPFLCFLALASPVAGAEPGSWRQIGEAADWRETVAGVVVGDRLFSVETDGVLYRTELGTGRWRPVGRPDFGDTEHLFAADDALFSIEKDGTLYRISPADGSWKRRGPERALAGTVALAVLQKTLYTVDRGGRLRATDLAAGTSSLVGTRAFGRTAFLFAAGESLGALEDDGSLYAIDPLDGTREQVGARGTWRDTLALAAMDGMIYTVEKSGRLYETDPRTGSWRALGDADFEETRFLFPGDGRLFTVEADGALYEIRVR